MPVAATTGLPLAIELLWFFRLGIFLGFDYIFGGFTEEFVGQTSLRLLDKLNCDDVCLRVTSKGVLEGIFFVFFGDLGFNLWLGLFLGVIRLTFLWQFGK